MRITDYHAKLFAHELTRRRPAGSPERLAGALVDAQVDLNPHQVEAALFAFRSPLARGALLADEVGLGKTIEAGLVMSQRWAERRRRILAITPSNLRKQWLSELAEKFFLPARILESRSFNEAFRGGNQRPFDGADAVVICSYQFAARRATDVAQVPWDLVVIDEAHRLRNVYKPSNVIANMLKVALKDAPKLLLTATPLQNSLLELYGLVSFVDEYAFGDLASFRTQFANLSGQGAFDTLRARLRPMCHRTLRRQVTAYVPFTRRHSMVQPFTPEESEDRLYILVSDYLRRGNLKALPARQRSLMTLVLRKLLASSSFAIAGALETLRARLEAQLGRLRSIQASTDPVGDDYEALDATAEEWPEEPAPRPELSQKDRAAIECEVADLAGLQALAVSITTNAKGRALLVALERAFDEAGRLGAERKAIIFTESRRTQEYLLRLLADSPFAEGIVLFNGSNSDARSREIYAEWAERHAGTDRVSGSRTADMRAALVDYFRERGRIMIATEAGAEGINLQFCSLVVNYDLPWNPQRIEQRIGRCHRYGQKHDVVVVNFLNRTNAADQRVFRLLAEKFSLFEGVFGASDEVLGAIESGVDFEKRIGDIYQRCRTPGEIEASFDALQADLGSEIDDAIRRTRQQLLEHFDEEVHEKLKVNLRDSQASLSRHERLLMDLTRHELGVAADFADGWAAFTLTANPFGDDPAIPLGLYELPRRSGEAHLYRLAHPLAERVLEIAGGRELPTVAIAFDYDAREARVAALEPFRGRSGVLAMSRFTVESLDQAEDYLLCAARTDDGEIVDGTVAERLFSLPAQEVVRADVEPASLEPMLEASRSAVLASIAERNARDFGAEAEKLDGWADDLKVALEREIKDLDRRIREARRQVPHGASLEAKLGIQKQIRVLETERTARRRSLFDAQDDIDARRDAIIAAMEAKLTPVTRAEPLFAIRWTLK